VTRAEFLELIRVPSFAYRGSVASSRNQARIEHPPALFCEGVALARLTEVHNTPLYVYSSEMIRSRLQAFRRAFHDVPHTLCYSVKANSTLGILRLMARHGAGFDVVSGGELERVLRVKRSAARQVVFSGVGKTLPEMEMALKAGILLFNVESASELRTLAAAAARLKKTARVAFRVNPDVSANTHPYISTGLHKHKFGVPITEARDLYAEAARERFLNVAGVSVHIGSQITDVGSFRDALTRVVGFVHELRQQGHDIPYVDAGGGLGISYDNSERSFNDEISEYAEAVTAPLRGLHIHLLLEPGRSIVGAAGVLLTRVLYRKRNNGKLFIIVDAAMNDLIRPSLYGAHHEIVPVTRASDGLETVDVVGPVCETGDFIARDRQLPVMREGDILAILDAGAYGASLASNYNSRGKAAEVLVEGHKARLIRKRQATLDLMRGET